MWINRDFSPNVDAQKIHPLKVLKGPRQVGKTSLLTRLGGYRAIYFDDLQIRQFAQSDPKAFFDQLHGPLILDEASLAPNIFPELKRRVDEQRRALLAGKTQSKKQGIDIWITGSNQTLLQQNVRESLAGRASYFDLNTLSIHETPDFSLATHLLRGGWPELVANPAFDHVSYLNDLISTFIERDIVSAAGIERGEAFARSLGLIAGRVGQLVNYSDIARNVGVDTTTLQSWVFLLEQNGLLRTLSPYSSNLNQRLIKTPKIYFEDVGLASRLQGWTESLPLMTSPSFGHLLENLAVSEVTKFFLNRGQSPEIYFVRSKEKVEIDLLIQLSNQRYIAAEIKNTLQEWIPEQLKLVESLQLNIIECWTIVPSSPGLDLPLAKTVALSEIWGSLDRLY